MSDDNLVTSAIKISMTLPVAVHAALKKEAELKGREQFELIQKILAEHVINSKMVDPAFTDEYRLFWSLVERAETAAKRRCREGNFSKDITMEVIDECVADNDWRNDYQRYVRDDIFKHGNPRKGPINRELGWRIKNGIGADVLKDEKGKALTVKVNGKIIQSYTPLENPKPDAFR